MNYHRTMRRRIENPIIHEVISKSDQDNAGVERRSLSEYTTTIDLRVTNVEQIQEEELPEFVDDDYDPVTRVISRALANEYGIKLVRPSKYTVASLMESVLNPVCQSSGLTCQLDYKLSMPSTLVRLGYEIVVDLGIKDESGSPVCIGHTEEPDLLNAFIDRDTLTLTPEFFKQDSVKELFWVMIAGHIRFGFKTNGQFLVLLEFTERVSFGLEDLGQGNQSFRGGSLSIGVAYRVLKVQNGSSLADFKRYAERADDAKKSNQEPRMFRDTDRLFSGSNTPVDAAANPDQNP